MIRGLCNEGRLNQAYRRHRADKDKISQYRWTRYAFHNIIYDNEDFALWKQEVQLELQEIYDRTRDKFICDILVLT